MAGFDRGFLLSSIHLGEVALLCQGKVLLILQFKENTFLHFGSGAVLGRERVFIFPQRRESLCASDGG